MCSRGALQRWPTFDTHEKRGSIVLSHLMQRLFLAAVGPLGLITLWNSPFEIINITFSVKKSPARRNEEWQTRFYNWFLLHGQYLFTFIYYLLGSAPCHSAHVEVRRQLLEVGSWRSPAAWVSGIELRPSGLIARALTSGVIAPAPTGQSL